MPEDPQEEREIEEPTGEDEDRAAEIEERAWLAVDGHMRERGLEVNPDVATDIRSLIVGGVDQMVTEQRTSEDDEQLMHQNLLEMMDAVVSVAPVAMKEDGTTVVTDVREAMGRAHKLLCPRWPFC